MSTNYWIDDLSTSLVLPATSAVIVVSDITLAT